MIDLFDRLTLEPMSVRLRRIAMWPVSEIEPHRKLGHSVLYVALDSIRTLALVQDSPGVLRYYRSLSPEIRRDKAIMAARTMHANKVSEEESVAAHTDLHVIYAGDPAIALHMIDYHFLRKEWDSLMRTIDLLDSTVYGDPYLIFFRALPAYMAKDFDAAKGYITSYRMSDPSDVAAYMMLLRISIFERHFDETVRLASIIREQYIPDLTIQSLGSSTPELASLPVYAEFLRSEEHVRWYASVHPDSSSISQ